MSDYDYDSTHNYSNNDNNNNIQKEKEKINYKNTQKLIITKTNQINKYRQQPKMQNAHEQ